MRYWSGIEHPLDLHTYRVYDCFCMAPVHTSVTTDALLSRRINVSLPRGTLRLLDRVARKGDRSHFIDEAVRRYVEDVSRTRLQKRLKLGAISRASRDLSLAEEWFPFEEEVWRTARE